MKTENLSTLKIHKLTKKQYERELAAGNIDASALYLTPDEKIDLTPYATIDYVDTVANTKAEASHEHTDLNNAISNLNTLVGNTSVSSQINTAVTPKVDKVDGKGLSTNDYTTPEKEKLAKLDPDVIMQQLNSALNKYQYVNTLPTTGVNGQIVFLKEVNSQYGNGLSTNLTILDSYYSTEADNSWYSNENIYSGNGTGSNGIAGNFRSKLVFSTNEISISSSSKLVVKIVLNGISSPLGCMGVLSTDNNIAPSSATSSLKNSAIATSYAYIDENKSELSGTNLTAETSFYFVFDTNKIVADTTYCLYLVKTTDHYSGSGWTQAARSDVEMTLTYNNGTINSGWYKCVPYVYEA